MGIINYYYYIAAPCFVVFFVLTSSSQSLSHFVRTVFVRELLLRFPIHLNRCNFTIVLLDIYTIILLDIYTIL